MFTLKLVKGLSYTLSMPDGNHISASKENPLIDVPDSMAEGLINSGSFEPVSLEGTLSTDSEGTATFTAEDGGEQVSELVAEPEPEYGGKTLEEMTTSELETFATYENVSLKGIRKKDAMIKKLREELPEEKTTGIIYYGSPTMAELQDH